MKHRLQQKFTPGPWEVVDRKDSAATVLKAVDEQLRRFGLIIVPHDTGLPDEYAFTIIRRPRL